MLSDIALVLFRMLVYEYVSNGNLEQWLHGAMRQRGVLTWEARMKIIIGIAKAYDQLFFLFLFLFLSFFRKNYVFFFHFFNIFLSSGAWK
jgi:hypothetical protein